MLEAQPLRWALASGSASKGPSLLTYEAGEWPHWKLPAQNHPGKKYNASVMAATATSWFYIVLLRAI